MLGLLIIGIAAVAVAAVLLYQLLTDAKKDADKNFSDKPVGDAKQPCPEKKKIKLVELVEVCERDTEGVVEGPGKASAKKATLVTRADKAASDYKQFINLEQDLEGKPKRHPEYGRKVLLRARIEWADGSTDPFPARQVQFTLKTEEKAAGRPATLETADQEGLGSAGGKPTLVASTDKDGWTSVLTLWVSAYAGDKFSVSALADEDGDGSFEGTALTAGNWMVWRRFWYQKTLQKGFAVPDPAKSVTAYETICAEMVKANTKEFEKADAPDRTFYPDWMVNPGAGGDDEVAVIGGHNRDEFYKMFVAEADKPVKGHLILCKYQWDPASAASQVQSFDITTSPSAELTIALNDWNTGITKPALSGALVKAATWESKAPAGHADHGRHGNLVEADILIEKGRAGLNAVKIKLPAGSVDPTVHPVTVTLQLAYGKYWGGESNVHQMLIVYNGVAAEFTQAVSHEFGHGFGQTPKAGKQPKPLVDHPQQYTGMGGQGSHCKTDATLSGGVYNNGTCIMFHQLNPGGCTQLFCNTCDPYLRLQDFTALRKSG